MIKIIKINLLLMLVATFTVASQDTVQSARSSSKKAYFFIVSNISSKQSLTVSVVNSH